MKTGDVTGSIGGNSAQRSDAEWRNSANDWSTRYLNNRSDPDAAINYAQALRATGQRAQAVAVLEQSALSNPHDRAVLGAYGRALADVDDKLIRVKTALTRHSSSVVGAVPPCPNTPPPPDEVLTECTATTDSWPLTFL